MKINQCIKLCGNSNRMSEFNEHKVKINTITAAFNDYIFQDAPITTIEMEVLLKCNKPLMDNILPKKVVKLLTNLADSKKE